MEDMERRNVMQYMLMLYLDAKRWAKMPEKMRTNGDLSQGRSYPVQSSESRRGGGLVEFGLARTSLD